jgi:hypothetical protein
MAGAYTGSADPAGLSPTNLAVFNGAALFEGKNAGGLFGLWTTDGSAIGTHQLPVSGASALGLDPNSMTVSNSALLFNGVDTLNSRGLWTTNGTGPGTHEVTGITGTNAAGLDPADFTVFSGKVLFNGDNIAAARGLWTTNGTGPGTHEVTGIVGAPTEGLGLDPSEMTVFGSEVLFNGTNLSGVVGLWDTDGTAVDTHEITVNGATAGGVNPSDMAVLGSKALFQRAEWCERGRPERSSRFVGNRWDDGRHERADRDSRR